MTILLSNYVMCTRLIIVLVQSEARLPVGELGARLGPPNLEGAPKRIKIFFSIIQNNILKFRIILIF